MLDAAGIQTTIVRDNKSRHQSSADGFHGDGDSARSSLLVAIRLMQKSEMARLESKAVELGKLAQSIKNTASILDAFGEEEQCSK